METNSRGQQLYIFINNMSKLLKMEPRNGRGGSINESYSIILPYEPTQDGRVANGTTIEPNRNKHKNIPFYILIKK
jgi:hypothetical protein